MAERCPTCGGAVKIVGDTTLHYEPDEHECDFDYMGRLTHDKMDAEAKWLRSEEEVERLRHLHGLDHTLADRFRTERDAAWGALRFYADADHYLDGAIDHDVGHVARAVLEKQNGRTV